MGCCREEVSVRDALFGMTIAVVGALLIGFSQPLAVLQVRSQPRFMHPWKNAVAVSRAIILVIGVGVVVSGLVAAIGGGWK